MHRFTFECTLEPLRDDDLHAPAVIAKLRYVDHVVPKMHDSVPGMIQLTKRKAQPNSQPTAMISKLKKIKI